MDWQRILFYSDLSPGADCALPFAMGLTRCAPGAHLYVVHVLPTPYRFYAEIVEPGLAMGLNPEMAKVAENTLRERYGEALEGGPDRSFHALVGVEGVELVRFVRKYRVEAMVMAATVAEARMGGLQATLRSFLAKRSPCPVVLVQPARQALRKRSLQGPTKVLEMRTYRRSRRRPVAEGPE